VTRTPGAGGASPPRLLIDGRRRDAADGATFPILSPATGTVIGAAPDAADEDS
jgi:acyl-CoA reductase-like NAD-dependent aldehyde dehydrogenase